MDLLDRLEKEQDEISSLFSLRSRFHIKKTIRGDVVRIERTNRYPAFPSYERRKTIGPVRGYCSIPSYSKLTKNKRKRKARIKNQQYEALNRKLEVRKILAHRTDLRRYLVNCRIKFSPKNKCTYSTRDNLAWRLVEEFPFGIVSMGLRHVGNPLHNLFHINEIDFPAALRFIEARAVIQESHVDDDRNVVMWFDREKSTIAGIFYFAIRRRYRGIEEGRCSTRRRGRLAPSQRGSGG